MQEESEEFSQQPAMVILLFVVTAVLPPYCFLITNPTDLEKGPPNTESANQIS